MTSLATWLCRPIWCGCLVTLLLVLIAYASVADAETARAPNADLYQGRVIVTGQDNLPERQRGIRDALQQVLVKLSGDAAIAQDPALKSMLPDAERFVASYRYSDRLAGVSPMDEQGTRERSQRLIVDFDHASVHRALKALGRRPWLTERPRLLALLVVKDAGGAYLVGTQTKRGFAQREAFRQGASDLGLPLVLPHLEEAANGGPTFEVVSGPTAGERVQRRELDTVLIGAMSVTEGGKWQSDWVLLWRETRVSWKATATTFDRAIEAALAHSAAHFAGLEPGAP